MNSAFFLESPLHSTVDIRFLCNGPKKTDRYRVEASADSIAEHSPGLASRGPPSHQRFLCIYFPQQRYMYVHDTVSCMIPPPKRPWLSKTSGASRHRSFPSRRRHRLHQTSTQPQLHQPAPTSTSLQPLQLRPPRIPLRSASPRVCPAVAGQIIHRRCRRPWPARPLLRVTQATQANQASVVSSIELCIPPGELTTKPAPVLQPRSLSSSCPLPRCFSFSLEAACLLTCILAPRLLSEVT